jgi:hypothetical protein
MAYPVTLTVEFPKKLSRLTTFFRFFMLIPQWFVLIFISIAAWVVMFLSWWAILFTARYPRVFFNFIMWWLRWYTRVIGYGYLLTDKYPPFSGSEEADYPVVLGVKTPGKLSRLTTFFRFPFVLIPMPTFILGEGWRYQLQPQFTAGMPMAIPHYIVLSFIGIAGVVILFLSWWAILFIGRYPRVFFDFITWWFRWSTRVYAYSYLLTDRYPPFTGSE